jgi:pSer/pThr/pTyr-binding forkhead associated (FHA) protein
MSDDSENTRSLKPVTSEPMPDRGPRPATGVLTHPWRLLLQIESENRTTVGLSLNERIVIGRSDEGEKSDLGLDLAPYGAEQHGVSRVHAAFSYDKGAIYIEDLDSTNGTRINGFQLEPKRLYRLRDGDELEFGRARMIVRFVRSSF